MALAEEKQTLLSKTEDKGKHYGAATAGKTNGKSSSAEAKPVSVTKLFRYASSLDKFLLFLGTLFAVVHGAGWPLLAIVFGDMTQTFIQQTQAGFVTTTNVSNTNPFVQIVNDNYTGITSTDRTTTFITINDDTGSIYDSLQVNVFNDVMTTFALYYVYIGLAVMLASYLQMMCWCITCERQIYVMRQEFFYQVLRQEIGWFDNRQSGELAMKLNDDLERVREGIGDKFSMFVQYISTFVSGFVVGFISSWELTLVIMSLSPLLALGSAYMGKLVASSTAREQQKYAVAGSIGEEVLSCIRTVISFCGQKYEIGRYTKSLKEGRDMAIRKYLYFGIGFGFTYLVLYGSYALAFWYGARLILANRITGGSVFTVFFAVMIGSFSLGNAFPYLASISTAKGSASNIFQVIDSKPEIDAYSEVGLQPSNFTANIEFRNISFHYPTRPSVKVLKNLSLNIREGQTIALCGHSGSGKSTIVSLLLRFYNPHSGSMNLGEYNVKDLNVRWLRSVIGVVSQEPVLFDCSIAENIQYGSNGASFADVVQAAKNANAHDFIAALPNGYDTVVGERGAQMSGGQKQRIAIARALVRDPKILLLDEATSALDSESEAIVQEALDKARQGRTTIIVAHRLSTIKNADMIYAMENGDIVEQGTHSELMDKEGLYYQLVTNQIFMDEAGYSTSESSTTSELIRKRQGSRTRSLSRLASVEKFRDIARLTEEVEREKVKIPSGWRIIKEAGPEWWELTYGNIAGIVVGGIMPAYAVFYAEIFNTFTKTGQALKDSAFFWAMMFLVLAVISCLSFFIRTTGHGKSGERLTMRLRQQSFHNILRQHAGWFDEEQHSTGKLATRLATDVPMVKTAAGHRIGIVISAISTLVTSLVIAFIFGWKLALGLTVAIPILLLAGGLQMKIMKGNQLRDAELMADAGKVVSEGVENIRTVQSLTQEPTFLEKFVMHLFLPYRESKKNAYVLALAYAFSEGIIFLIYAAAFRFGAFLISNGDMEAINVYRVFFALAFSAVSVGQWTSYLPDYTKAKLSAGMIFHLIETEPQIDSLSAAGVKPSIKGEVTLNDVHFRYPNRADVPVLRGINLNIKPGETLALVGPSGCGKSTVVSLVQRFYDPQHGQVKVDDFDIRTLNLMHLRKHIAVVSQEPVLFNSTIRQNITYGMGDPVPHERVEEAARSANVHDFINNLPAGYDTMVGEKGTQLSGGQKQRIAIARALVRDPKILLLDEATSALDTESEKLVQDALDRARCGRTCIVIAHRLSTIQGADCIAVVDRGIVVEKGTHEELVLKRGTYYRLTKRQRIKH